MTTAISTAETLEVERELLPGYYVEEATGALLTLPWPKDLAELPPSIAPGVIRWAEHWLRHHLEAKPWRFTRDQKRFLHLWYAVDERGRFVYRTFCKRGAKGTGKDPFCAAMALIELAGPVIPVVDEAGHLVYELDAAGNPTHPRGRPHRMALVQIGANSEAQAKDVLRVANGMVSQPMADEFRLDLGITQTTTAIGGRIELLTNSESSAEGDPATAIFLNETHHMTASSGRNNIAGVARRNAAKAPGGRCRVGELTNSHAVGEDSVAEDAFDAWQLQVAGKTRRRSILYDSREASPELRIHVPEELMVGLRQAYADSPWTDLESLLDDIEDPRTPVADSIRYYFNGLPTNEDAWVDPRNFDARARGDIEVLEGDAVAVFLDCSKSEDSTALVGCRLSDGHVFTLGVWQRPHGNISKRWLAPRNEVDAKVAETFELFDVQWFGVDPSPARDDETEAQYWAALVDEWHRRYREEVVLWADGQTAASRPRRGHAVAFDMRTWKPGGKARNAMFTAEAELTMDTIDDGPIEAFTHDGNGILRLHVINARRRRTQWGIGLSKQSRGSTKKIDLAVAMVGARLGRRLVLNSGVTRKRRSGRVV